MSPLDLIPEIDEKLIISMIYCAILPGSIGGMATFFLSLREGHYKNNKYIAKFLVEITGGALTAPFIVNFIDNQNIKASFAFLIGVGWASILQMIRKKITKVVETFLGEKFSGANK